MSSITACLWIKTKQTAHLATFISYDVSGKADTFVLFDPKGPRISITDIDSKSPENAQVNDGNWQHLCATWKSQDGAYKIYRNGSIVDNGSIAMGKTILGGGTWVLGQERPGGKFQARQAFQGEMAEVSIFDKVLSSTEILEMSKTCLKTQNGNVKSWNDFRSGVEGDVREVLATCC